MTQVVLKPTGKALGFLLAVVMHRHKQHTQAFTNVDADVLSSRENSLLLLNTRAPSTLKRFKLNSLVCTYCRSRHSYLVQKKSKRLWFHIIWNGTVSYITPTALVCVRRHRCLCSTNTSPVCEFLHACVCTATWTLTAESHRFTGKTSVTPRGQQIHPSTHTHTQELTHTRTGQKKDA